MRLARSFVILTLVILSSISLVRADIAERFGGIGNSNLVASASQVTTWRTVGSFQTSKSFEDMMKRFNKAGTGTVVSSNLAAQLSRILLDEHSYMSPEVRDNCIHEPDLCLTLSDGKKSLDVFFCLGCEVMMVKTGDRPKGQPPITSDSLFAEGVPQKIIHIMKQIFPKDNAIQGLDDN